MWLLEHLFMALTNKHFPESEEDSTALIRRLRFLIILLLLASGFSYLFYYLRNQSLDRASQREKFLAVLSAVQSAELSLYQKIGAVKRNQNSKSEKSDEEALLLQADYEMIRSDVERYSELLTNHLNSMQEILSGSKVQLQNSYVQFKEKATDFLSKNNVNAKAVALYFNHGLFLESGKQLQEDVQGALKNAQSQAQLYKGAFWFFLVVAIVLLVLIIFIFLRLISLLNQSASRSSYLSSEQSSHPVYSDPEKFSVKISRTDFNGIPGSFLILDKSGRILAASEDFLSFFHLRIAPEDLKDRPVREFIQFYKDGKEVFLQQYFDLRNNSGRLEADAITRDGFQLKLKIRGRVYDNSFWGNAFYIMFSEDDSPHHSHQLENAGQEIERLEAEVRRLKDLVAELEKKSENAGLLREEFVTNLSHEIRTPLNIIIGYGNLLKDTHLTIEQTEYVNAILTSAYNILSLANNILDAARLDAGMLQLVHEEFNLRNVLASVELMFSHKAHQKRLDFSVHTDPDLPENLVGDSIRFTQILSNLVDNALKFTSKGYVRLKTEKARESQLECWVRVIVEDSGIGIPEDKIEDIFKRFNQVGRGLDPRFGGSGLGLTIVRSLVELMGGKISVSSKFGKGTTFVIELPFAKEQEASSASDPLKAVVQSHVLKDRVPKILLVEDNDVNRRLASLLLSKHNFYVETSGNGKEALEKLQEESFDLVLMDVRMPVMDGIEASRRIRTELGLNMPIIGVTAAVELEEDKKLGLSAGMNDFIFKPINPEELLAKINALLQWMPKKSHSGESQTAASVWTLPETVVNLEYLYTITEGNEEFIEDILGTFFSKVAYELEDLLKHCRNRNFEELRFVAHKLKSSFNIIQFDKVVELLNEIDQTQSTEVSWSRFDFIVKFIHMLFEKGIEELKRQFPKYYNKYYRTPSTYSGALVRNDYARDVHLDHKDSVSWMKQEMPKAIIEKRLSGNGKSAGRKDKRLEQEEGPGRTMQKEDNGFAKEKGQLKKPISKPNRKSLKKVLIADDESLVLKTLKFRLEKEGLEVITAMDGREAIEKFKEEKPDLVITDLMMPFHNGIEVIQAITESDHPCPVIVLSAVGQEKTVIDAFKAGASDFISKPFSPDEINIRLKKFVSA